MMESLVCACAENPLEEQHVVACAREVGLMSSGSNADLMENWSWSGVVMSG